MIEVVEDLWDIGIVKVITTNGYVTKDMKAVMGRGCALEAKLKFPGIDETLGRMLHNFGNVPHIINLNPIVVSFPTKYHWKEMSDIGLIERSGHKLRSLADEFNWSFISMPRPGCGNGRLNWDDVKPVLWMLDSKFYVCQK